MWVGLISKEYLEILKIYVQFLCIYVTSAMVHFIYNLPSFMHLELYIVLQ